MRTVLLFIFILLSIFLHGQDKIKVKKEKPLTNAQKKANSDSIRNSYRVRSFTTFDVTYGHKIFSNSFYGQLNKIDSFHISAPPRFVGLGLSNPHFYIGPRGDITFHMLIGHYLRTPINIIDSLPSELTGFSYHFGIGKFIRFRTNKFALNIYTGFNTGRLKLSFEDNSKKINPFFSPKLSIQPKIRIWKRFLLSLIIEYERDISKVNWKETNSKGMKNVRGFDQTGLVTMITLGIVP